MPWIADAIPIKKASREEITRASSLIKQGDVISFPTETLYGLAADALNHAAVDALLALKGRHWRQSIPVLVADMEMMNLVVSCIPDQARPLIEAYWPGPLTLVLPALDGLPSALVNERGGIGVRISSDPVATLLTKEVGRPITATSANRAGTHPATCGSDARLEGIAMVLDDGKRDNPPSTVIEVLDLPVLLRSGAVKVKTL